MRFLSLTLIVLWAPMVSAQSHWSTYGLYERWVSDEAPAHVALALNYDTWLGHTWLNIRYNTETVRIGISGLRLTEQVSLGADITGEALFSNVLNDHYLDGQNQLERGIAPSYVLARSWLDVRLKDDLTLQAAAGVRRWFHARTKHTADELTLPADSLVLEPEIALTYWRLEGIDWRDGHRVFPRLNGIAMGLGLGARWQHDTRAWGALDPDAFARVDIRNRPDPVQLYLRQWLKAGKRMGALRLEVEEEAAAQFGEDDLYRRQIGGLNPFGISLPGSPWAYLHAGDYVGGQLRLRWVLNSSIEVGPIAGIVAVRDIDRRGDDAFSFMHGYGLLFELREGPWQFDLRGGYSPTMASKRAPEQAWNALLVIGYGS